MKISKALLVALVVGLVAIVFLIKISSSKKSVEIPVNKSDNSLEIIASLMAKNNLSAEEQSALNNAFANAYQKKILTKELLFEYGKQQLNNPELRPMVGIGIIRDEVLGLDSNYIPAIEFLAEKSVQSGQFDKAILRYKKLLSLQPENEKFKHQLDEVLKMESGSAINSKQ
ncbi:MAG: hypothetical protein H6607_10185 [Flavobacteriales bacterium]|nr:hypothetical protein [Flavobacteriales bacterium]